MIIPFWKLQGSPRKWHRYKLEEALNTCNSIPGVSLMVSTPLVWTDLCNHLSVPNKGLIKLEDFCSHDLLTTILDHAAGFFSKQCLCKDKSLQTMNLSSWARFGSYQTTRAKPSTSSFSAKFHFRAFYPLSCPPHPFFYFIFMWTYKIPWGTVRCWKEFTNTLKGET